MNEQKVSLDVFSGNYIIVKINGVEYRMRSSQFPRIVEEDRLELLEG